MYEYKLPYGTIISGQQVRWKLNTTSYDGVKLI